MKITGSPVTQTVHLITVFVLFVFRNLLPENLFQATIQQVRHKKNQFIFFNFSPNANMLTCRRLIFFFYILNCRSTRFFNRTYKILFRHLDDNHQLLLTYHFDVFEYFFFFLDVNRIRYDHVEKSHKIQVIILSLLKTMLAFSMRH